MQRANNLYSWKGLAIVGIAVASLFLATAEAKTKSQARSVWKITGDRTISSRDIYNNRISVVCGRSFTIYVSTVQAYASSGRNLNIDLWASRDFRLPTRAYAQSEKSYSISLPNGVESTDSLIKDMRNRYDLTMYFAGNRGTGIVIFALDGFADKLRIACGR